MNQYLTKLHWRSSASFRQTTYRERAESRPSQLSGNPRLVAPPGEPSRVALRISSLLLKIVDSGVGRISSNKSSNLSRNVPRSA